MGNPEEIQSYVGGLLRHRTKILCLGASSYSVNQGLSVDLFQDFSRQLDSSYSIRTGFPVLLIFVGHLYKPCLELGDVSLVLNDRKMTFHLMIAENPGLSDFAFILTDSFSIIRYAPSMINYEEDEDLMDRLIENFKTSHAIIFDYSPYRFVENKRLVERINKTQPEVSVSVAIVCGRKRSVDQDVSCEEDQVKAVEGSYDSSGIVHSRVAYSLDIRSLSDLLMAPNSLRVKSSREFLRALDMCRFYMTDMLGLLFLEGRDSEIVETFDGIRWKGMFKDYLKNYSQLDFLYQVFPDWESTFDKCSEDCRRMISDTTNVERRERLIKDVLFKPFTDILFSTINIQNINE